MHDFMLRIPISSLPKTFRDAIVLARQLGSRFMWIDALCIVQDDEEDWQHEAATMIDVFSNSMCHIAAAASEDVNGGLFQTRDPERVGLQRTRTGTKREPPTTEIQVRESFKKYRLDSEPPTPLPFAGFYNTTDGPWLPKGISETVVPEDLSDAAETGGRRFMGEVSDPNLRHLVRPVPASSNISKATESIDNDFHSYWQQTLDSTVLMSRAWVQQECLLPVRILYFTASEVLWDCHQLKACESLPLGPPDFGRLSRSSREILHDAMTSDVPQFPLPLFLRFWAQQVEIYSRRQLTYPSDKLVAIDGIARVLRNGAGGDYIAGLWRNGLESQLLWCTHKLFEQAEYRAPSWSWASVDGPVDWNINIKGNTETSVLLKEVAVVTAAFSRVTRGSITLCGVLLTVEFGMMIEDG